jgi:hypothetical protein
VISRQAKELVWGHGGVGDVDKWQPSEPSGKIPTRESSIGIWVIGISGTLVTRCLCTLDSRSPKPRQGGRYHRAASYQHAGKEGSAIVGANCPYSGESRFGKIGNPVGKCFSAFETPKPRQGDKTEVTGITVVWVKAYSQES